MRSTVRSFVLGAGVLLAAGASAQYPYWLYLNGTVSNCYPGQTVNVITVQGTQPAYDWDIPVDPNTCTWSVSLGLNTSPSWFQASTLCNGMVVNFTDQVNFNFQGDSAIVNVTLDCGNGNPVDCNGVENGPDMPGTPCDDGNPMTSGDLWTPACVCVGQGGGEYDCLGILNGPNVPGYLCDGYTSDSSAYVGVWTVDCICVDTNQTDYDCLGVYNGTALPGTPCVDFFGTAGVWSANCICQTNIQTDCEGNPGGNAWPGTACVYTPDSGNTWVTGIWTVDCICGPDSAGFIYDCLGVINGPNVPGMPCIVPGTTIEGTWNSACVCDANNPEPCNADFWVIQAMGPDSLPVPYELWVWNLSSGNVGYTWDFGDGTTSTVPFPTHTYSGNGPYNLCLTVADNNGCTDTHCDSISINADGVYEGMVVHADVRQDGFTINVQAGEANAVQEVVAGANIAMWPNPAVDELNVAVVSEMQGFVTVTITDLDGRTVRTERTSLGGGRSQLRIATSGLNAGMYLLRISDGTVDLSQRFVKVD